MNADRKSIAVIDPANEEVIGEVPRQTAADADRAVGAAREVFLKWRWVPGNTSIWTTSRKSNRIGIHIRNTTQTMTEPSTYMHYEIANSS